MIWTLVDSNILLDLLSRDKTWFEWSQNALTACRLQGSLAINQLVYAEIAPAFTERGTFDHILARNELVKEELPWEAAYLAGHTHAIYRKSGGPRERVLPDFLIGAHAAVKGHRLLTRDPRRYRSYFPDLRMIAPDAAQ